MLTKINQFFGDMDLPLMDFLLKGKIQLHKGAKILDVGCGVGRNLSFFIQNDFQITGIDTNEKDIVFLNTLFQKTNLHFEVGDFKTFNFTEKFDLIICSRFLHFAENEQYFWKMWYKLSETLAPKGQIYLAMDSVIDYEKSKKMENGNYEFPDGRIRFGLTNEIYQKLKKGFIENEPLKTTIYHNERAQSFGLFQKN